MKPGSSYKVLIDPKPAVLRIWNVWKTTQLFVKLKFAPDADIGKDEWHAGGGQWNNERLLGPHIFKQEKFVDVLEKAGVGGHSTQGNAPDPVKS